MFKISRTSPQLMITQVVFEVCRLLKAQASSVPHPLPMEAAETPTTRPHPFLASFLEEEGSEEAQGEVRELVGRLNSTGDWTLLHPKGPAVLFALLFAFLAHIKVHIYIRDLVCVGPHQVHIYIRGLCVGKSLV